MKFSQSLKIMKSKYLKFFKHRKKKKMILEKHLLFIGLKGKKVNSLLRKFN